MKGDAISRFGVWAVVLAGLAGVLYTAFWEARQSKGVPGGAKAPELVAQRYSEGTFRLSEQKGHVVMLDFWATWCPPCREEMPTLVKLAGEYTLKGLTFVAANQDNSPDAKAAVGVFIAREVSGLEPYVVFPEDRAAQDFRVELLPTLYLIGRDGRVIDTIVGPESEPKLRARIEDALRN